MKFLKFVSCYGLGSGESKEVVAETAAAVRRRREETTALVAGVSRKVWRRRRVSGGAEWKPTLGSISEDNVPVVVAAERVAAQRAVKRKSGGGGGSGGGGSSYGGRRDSRDIASIANYDEDYDHRQGRYTGVFPVFAPTPFML